MIGAIPAAAIPLPVIVVGNITTGGSGKTPVVIWLVQWLQQLGWRPGVVSRGYGRRYPELIREVFPDSNPLDVGDEPLLIRQRASCPVVVDRDRIEGINRLRQDHDCNIVISDDGMQHYAMPRTLEIAVVDAARKFGNGWCLPAGPMREPESRLKHCDLVLMNYKNASPASNEDGVVYVSDVMVSFSKPDKMLQLNEMTGRRVHGIAGIADPDQFFRSLTDIGVEVIPHGFSDHHKYEKRDIVFNDMLPVIMTEKDAVKIRYLFKSLKGVQNEYWYVPIQAQPVGETERMLRRLIEEKIDGQKTA